MDPLLITQGASAGVPNDHLAAFIRAFFTDVIKVGNPIGNEEWVSWHAKPKVHVKLQQIKRKERSQ